MVEEMEMLAGAQCHKRVVGLQFRARFMTFGKVRREGE